MTAKSKSNDLQPGTGIGDATGGPAGGASTPAKDRSRGQKVSQERGTATNNKKSPGKRPKQGGN